MTDRPGRGGRDALIALGLFAVTFTWMLATSRDVGVARDEGIYINGAEAYVRYVEEVEKHPDLRQDKDLIARHYRVNSEHPPLTKHLYGLSWRLLHRCTCHQAQPTVRPVKPPHQTLGWLSDLTAFRLPAFVMTGVLIAFIYLLGAEVFGRTAGLLSALSYVVIPRVFFHSHLAGLDAPITTAMVVTVYAYYRALESWRWSLAAGLCFGLALLTKFNAFFLPLLLLAHYAWASRREFRHPLLVVTGLLSLLPLVLLSGIAFAAGGSRTWLGIGAAALVGIFLLRRESLRRPLRTAGLLAPAVFWSMLLLGFPVFYLQWPWLWHDTVARFSGYLTFHLEHTFYNTEYFGRNLNLPPFPMAFPFVVSALALPLPFLLAATSGLALAAAGPLAWVRARLRREPVDWTVADPPGRGFGRPLLGNDLAGPALVVLNAGFWFALLALPSTPKFGGARLWMPAWPFLAILAGSAVAAAAGALATRLRRPLAAPILVAGLGLALVLPPLLQTLHAGDVGASWYAPAAGGPAGAADLGFRRQDWGYATRRLLPTLDALAAPLITAPHSRVPTYFHDTNAYSRDLYARNGLLRPNVTYAGDGHPGIRHSRIALYLHEKHQVMWEQIIWQEYGTVQPTEVLTLDGVPLVTVYTRRPADPPPRPPFFIEPPGWLTRRSR
jgi:4-amino-4-deoxy-L-arabinose transferase-like glycosyltransferase